ncbi:PIN domain-containing protein [Microbacterium jejuense]|uniref:PIN domain-containing protein n=1 Tax=Microbacterium jejuense TaxID=1263637 RepID=A0ABS7HRC5_9MICO|nr:PIN domain-containing protein [Microbacterium jejuense]MBW9095418.1 PIN domain-containing protein [Microbacterium jejuense]
MTIAFDADVLIYAAVRDHPLGARVRGVLDDARTDSVGSVLLLPEVLAKPLRDGPGSAEVEALLSVLARMDLRPFDEPTARLSVILAAEHNLRAADAAHLATAIASEADRFVTNNRKDFPRSIPEIEIVYPDDLPAVG